MKINKLSVFFVALVTFTFTGVGFSAPQKPMTAAELALYNGPDRQQILEEGAKKEGKLVFYTVGIMQQSVRPVLDAFQKKYPYIKVEVWRAGTNSLLPRALQEYEAGRHNADVIEVTQTGEMILREKGVLQPFYTPSIDVAKAEKGSIITAPEGGIYAGGIWETTRGIGYNTKLIKKEALPKTYQDLLDPRWKGKIPITGSNTGLSWMGAILHTYGEDFIKKLAAQNFQVHMVSAHAILDLVIAQEYPFSPTISDAHARDSKAKGAPVDWLPLEPAPSYIGLVMLVKNLPHPHAALLYMDFDLSEQAADLYIKAGYTTPRKRVDSSESFQRSYGPWSIKEEMEWSNLFNKLFIKK